MNLIVAVDNKYGIGKNNDLLCKLKNDMNFFKETTKNKIVVMGRKTCNSIPNMPLKNRENIVITRSKEKEENGIKYFNKLPEKYLNDDNVFIIGGSQIYELYKDYINIAYVTYIEKDFNADTFLSNSLINLLENSKKEELYSYEENNIKYKIFKCEIINAKK